MLPDLDTALEHILQRFPRLRTDLPMRCVLVSAPAWRRRCLGARLDGGVISLRIPSLLLEESWVTRLEWMVHGILHGVEQEETGRQWPPLGHSEAFRRRASSVGLALRQRAGDFDHNGCEPELFDRLERIAVDLLSTPVDLPGSPRTLYRVYECGCGTIAVRGTLDAYCPRCDRDLVLQRGGNRS